jgi:hypothetical protein
MLARIERVEQAKEAAEAKLAKANGVINDLLNAFEGSQATPTSRAAFRLAEKWLAQIEHPPTIKDDQREAETEQPQCEEPEWTSAQSTKEYLDLVRGREEREHPREDKEELIEWFKSRCFGSPESDRFANELIAAGWRKGNRK